MKAIIHFFTENYKLTIILSLFLIVYGAVGIKQMNAEKFPAVSMATAKITTQYEGASAEDIEIKITKPLEDEIRGVVGIKDISSVSKSGLSMITVRVDMDNYVVRDVMDEIQKKVDGTTGLPSDLKDRPDFFEINSEEMPVYNIAILGQNQKRERDIVAEDLQEVLEDIEAIKSVHLRGYSERRFQIELDASKLEKYHISIAEVLNKISSRNVTIPGGQLKKGEDDSLVRVDGKIQTDEDLRNFVVRSNFAGPKILLGEIATVTDGQEQKRIYTRYNEEPSTELIVIKKAGKDSIKLVKEIKSKIENFKKTRSEQGIKIVTFLDASKEVENKLNVLLANGITGLILVVFFLFLFMPGKIGFAASISLPLAVMATFGIMPLFGMNLDSITILALIIAIGMLVDNSVVISETYTKYREDGMSPKEAARLAVTELWGAITASALTTVAAFLPMLATKGIMGAFIYSIPIVVTVALLFSLIESFFLLPIRLMFFAKNIKIKKEANSGIYIKFEKKFTKILNYCVNHRYLMLGGFLGILIISGLFIVVFNKFVLFPADETEIYMARFETKTGTSVEGTDQISAKLAKQIREKMGDKIEYVTVSSGEQRQNASDPKGADGANIGLIKIYVTEKTKFNIHYSQILQELRTIQAPYLKKLSFEEIINGPPVGSAVEAKLRSNNQDCLVKMANKIVDDLMKVEGIKDVKVDDIFGENEIDVKIDFMKADSVGLSAKEIGDTIRTAISGKIISQVTLNNKNVYLQVRVSPSFREDIKDLETLKILNGKGDLISLSTVASFQQKNGAPQIKRYNGKRSKTIVANVDSSIITSKQANDLLKNSFDKHQQTIKEVTLYQGGSAESTSESMNSLTSASVMALLGILALLVFMFKSFLKPVIIMTTIPLGLFGFSVAFYLHNRPISFLALIGVIGLAGVIVNSGIVLIDHIDHMKKNSTLKLNELLAVASTDRLKAVLVTSLTTISGLFPTAYGIGGTDSVLIPLTLAMAWGLTTGTILTLIWVPCAYGILEDMSQLFKKANNKKSYNNT